MYEYPIYDVGSTNPSRASKGSQDKATVSNPPFSKKTSKHTLSKAIDRQSPMRVLSQILKRDLRLALPDHQMHNDQTLEHDGPRRVAEAVREGAEDLGDTCLTGVRGHEDVLNIFGLGRRELRWMHCLAHANSRAGERWMGWTVKLTLILVPPLTDFSKELAMGVCVVDVPYAGGNGTSGVRAGGVGFRRVCALSQHSGLDAAVSRKNRHNSDEELTLSLSCL